MIDWQVKHEICGLAELAGHGGVTHLLSIIDPEQPEPGWSVADAPPERLTLRFHDAIVPYPDHVLARREDVEAMLAFGRTLAERDPAHLLIHCHMGISRSTAAAAALLAQADPAGDEDAILTHIQSIRPQAWPNSLIVRHADALLGRQGRLVAALGRLYRRQLVANPRFADPLRSGGRAGELEMAEAASLTPTLRAGKD